MNKKIYMNPANHFCVYCHSVKDALYMMLFVFCPLFLERVFSFVCAIETIAYSFFVLVSGSKKEFLLLPGFTLGMQNTIADQYRFIKL